MNSSTQTRRRRNAFTLTELMVAMIASSFLLAGLGSVVFIARQVAYSPTAAARRAKTADLVNLISDELRYATIIIQQTPQILEFVVADRNNDGTSEKIRYEWSGTAGAPLRKTINGGTPVDVLGSVYAFGVTLQQKSKTTTLTTTTESAEAVLLSNAGVLSGSPRDINTTAYSAQQINPNGFAARPANAVCWNATKVEFFGRSNGTTTDTLFMQLRPSGDPYDGPTSNVLAEVSIAEALLPSSANWYTAVFANPVRGLSLHRNYTVAWGGAGSGDAARLRVDDSAANGVLESNDGGATWQYMTTRQMFYKVWGTYSTPGTTYNVTRNYVSHVRLALQSGIQSHARIDASAPLRNSPELLSAHCRADFDRNPATTNANGDSVADWAVTGNGTFDTAMLVGGIWMATGAIETRPLSDFITTTTVDVRCRNTSVGGNGAVVALYADRQGGQYAPLVVYVQKQADGTQTLSLNGKTADNATKQLFNRGRLSSGFVRFRLTVLPQFDVVNLQINDEDQGTFTYPKYVPTSTNDRYLTLYTDTSSSEFDYIDVRASTN